MRFRSVPVLSLRLACASPLFAQVKGSGPAINDGGVWKTDDAGGLYKSVDGGATWKKLVTGLPSDGQGMGHIVFDVAPSDSQRLVALVNAGAPRSRPAT